MKKLLVIFLFFSMICFSLFSQVKYQTMRNCCDSYDVDIFLQSFNAKIYNRDTLSLNPKWSISLPDSIVYRFSVCESEELVILDLYDPKMNLVGSTYNKKTKKNGKMFQYKCIKGGTYTVVFRIIESCKLEKIDAVGCLYYSKKL